MLTLFQATFLGLLQGITELFPISSLGHAALLPALLGWHIDESSDSFVSFVVLTHLATAIALFFHYRRDWVRIIRDTLASVAAQRFASPYARLGCLLAIATIPAGLLGFLLQAKLQLLFANPRVVAGALVANGILMYLAERFFGSAAREAADDRKIARTAFSRVFGIGLAQSLALIPGMSRTGVAMEAGLACGLSRENAARFAFLLATPIIFAAAILKAPRVLTHASGELVPALIGAVSALIASYASVRFLGAYFRSNTLKPFAGYCVIAGLFALLLLSFNVVL